MKQAKNYKSLLGIDKGYTEAFFDSEGKRHGEGLGILLTQKSNRITKKNRNRGKLFALHRKLKEFDEREGYKNFRE